MHTAQDLLTAASKTYERHEKELLTNHTGEFALIKGRRLVGVYSEESQAESEARRRFRNRMYIIMQIEPRQSVKSF